LIKVSKGLDFSLVSNKSLSEILLPSGLGLGPDEVGHYRHEDLPNLLRVWTAL